MRTKNPNALTAKEKKEETFVTIGRLRGAIKGNYPKERLLALLEKISEEVSDMDIELMHFRSKLGENDML